MSFPDPFGPSPETEQARAALADFARFVAAYHRQLVAEGFTREEALALTIAWQTTSMERKPGDDEE